MKRSLAQLALAVAATACCAGGTADSSPQPDTRPAATATGTAAATKPEVPASAPKGVARGQETWGSPRVAWRQFQDGVAEARVTKKPILLVVYGTWCPHCTNYSRVFEDGRVAAMANEFVMIKVDGDKEPDVAAKYVPGQKYVPRTFFLTSSAEPSQVRGENPRFPYFYDEHEPESLLEGMRRARLELAAK